jgi:thioredoxin reductase (NADPH)
MYALLQIKNAQSIIFAKTNIMSQIEHLSCLIIGSGPAGYTAAIYAARADMKPVMYQGMQPGGQLTTTNEVENFPGYPDGVTGPEMMLQLEAQAKRFETDVRNGFITKVDFSGSVHKCWTEDGHEIHADTVIISTGASAKYLGLESEQKYLKLGGGVSACAVCDGFFYRNQEVVIVGAGDSACEEAHYLSKLCKKVTMLVRRDAFRASKIMAERVKNTPNIDIRFNTETVEVLGDGQPLRVSASLTEAITKKARLPAQVSLWQLVTNPTQPFSKTTLTSTKQDTSNTPNLAQVKQMLLAYL